MNDTITTSILSSLGSVLIYLLLGVGLFFTWRLGCVQLRHFFHMFSLLSNGSNKDKAGISPFQALCTGLAARIGTGNLTGVAIALTLGGPGAIFWMWFMAFIGMAIAFAESALAQLYKTRDDEGNYCGGPAYYMEKGLDKRWMGILFSIFLIIAFGLVFNAVQAQSIAQAMQVAFGFKSLYVGLFLVLLSGIIIFGGSRAIARVAELVVPFMAIAYLLLTLWIVGTHLDQIPAIIVLIFKSAFGWQQAGAGIAGHTLGQAMIHGIKRGLFSNEAGMGSAPNIAAAVSPYPPHPATQGYVQMLGVFLNTAVICTATAVIILCSGMLETTQGVSGINLVQEALSVTVGDWGPDFIALAVFFFAFTSIIANYAYAESNLIFLKHQHKTGLTLFRLAALAMVMFGTLADLPIVWCLADISMSLMAITNLVALVLLSNTVVKIAQDYNQQHKIGQLPTFNPAHYPEIKPQLEPDIWHPLPQK